MVGKSGKYLALEDVNGDGLLALVCQVLIAELIIDIGKTDWVRRVL